MISTFDLRPPEMVNARWLVQLADVPQDMQLAGDVLQDFGVSLVPYDGGMAMFGPHFEGMNSSQEVYDAAGGILAAIDLAARVGGISLGLKLGRQIFECRPDGSERKTTWTSIHAIAGGVRITVTASIIPGTELSDEARESTIKRQQEAEDRQRLARLSSYARIAYKNPNVAEVLGMLLSGVEPYVMYKIGEIIRDDLKGDLTRITSNDQFKRFTASTNHPAIAGAKARHARTKSKPHSSPMSEKKQEQYVRALVERWIVHLGTMP